MKSKIITSEKVKLFFDPGTGTFKERGEEGEPFIVAEKEVSTEQRMVAVIDVTGSQSREQVEHYLQKAKEFGITEVCQFPSNETMGRYDGQLPSDIIPIEDFIMPKQFGGETTLNFLKTIPKDIMVVFFTDGELDLYKLSSMYRRRSYMLYIWKR